MPHPIKIPAPVKKGVPILANDWNTILALFQCLDISGGPGIQVSKTTRGITISFTGSIPKFQGGGGGGSVAVRPFDVSFSPNDDTHFNASIQPGTINGLIATGYGTDVSVLSSGTLYYLVITVTSTDGHVTGAALTFETTAPGAIPIQEGLPPTSFAYALGMVQDSIWYRTIGAGSLTAVGQEMFRTSKTSPDPGTLPYDIHYTWVVIQA